MTDSDQDYYALRYTNYYVDEKGRAWDLATAESPATRNVLLQKSLDQLMERMDRLQDRVREAGSNAHTLPPYHYQYPTDGRDGTDAAPEPDKRSPSLPEHIYVRQEGSVANASIYDADSGEKVKNVTDVEVTLSRKGSKVKVTADDGTRTYPVQDLTVDANSTGEK